MKALVLTAYGTLELKDVPVPAYGATDVLVRVKACGICGSDVHGLDGSTGRRIPPVIMGHEASGIIAEVGKDVEGWKPGDRVTFDSMISCGTCWHCGRGEINLCDKGACSVSPATNTVVTVRSRSTWSSPGGSSTRYPMAWISARPP
jgi:L-iditol 2-dehydrogenase